MATFQYRPGILIFGIIFIGLLTFINPSYDLYSSKYAFLLMSFLLVILISIKSNGYVINAHNLFALGIFWFIWIPLFDILFIHQVIPQIGIYYTRIDDLSSRDDSSLVNIIFFTSILILSYVCTVSVISRFFKRPQTPVKNIGNGVHVNYALLQVCLFVLLALYFILILNNVLTPVEVTHWSEVQSHGSGTSGYILSNINFLLTSMVYFLVIYTYNNPRVSRNTWLLVLFLVVEIIVFNFLDNSRIFLLSFLIGLAAVFERLGIKINWKMVFVFCVFFFGFMVFVSLRRSFTDLDFIQLIGQIDAFNGISFVNIARKEFEIYPGIGYWLTLYDLNKFENFPYSNAAYVFKTLFFWLPSELFGFQEAPFTSYLGFYLTNDPLFSCNITSIGELALMFGWPSILVLGVTCGIFTYLLDIKYLRQFKNFNFLIFAVIILQIMRGPFYYFLSQILLLTLAWWLIYMFFIRKERSV
jgi:hypothetical protein